MSNFKLIVKNSFFLFLDRIMRGFLLMGLTILIARVLDVKAFGVYALAITVAGLFKVFADFGTTFLVTHEVAKSKKQISNLFWHTLVLKIVIGIIGFALLVVISYFFYEEHVRTALWIAAGAGLLRLLVEFQSSFFSGYEKMNFVSIIMIVYMGLVVMVSVIMLGLGIRTPAILVSGYLWGGVLTLPVASSLLFKNIAITKVRFELQEMKRLFILAIPFGLYFISDMIYFHTDIVMLSVIRGEQAVGIYQSAMKFNQLLEALPLLLASALFPTVSRMYLQAIEQVAVILNKSMNYIIILAIPLAVGGYLFADSLMVLLYGEKYYSGIIIFKILMIMLPFRFSGFIFGMLLTATGGQSKRMGIVAISACINIILNAWWIPLWGVRGAAVASVISAIVLTVTYGAFSASLWKLKGNIILFLKVLMASTIMGLFIHLTKNVLNLWVGLVLSALIYILCLLLIKGFNQEDWGYLKRLLKKS